MEGLPMKKAMCVFFALAALLAGPAIADAQAPGAASTSGSPSGLSAVDANFVAQANLGAPFQIDSGRIAERKATTARIRDYAHLMVTSHGPVVNALSDVLKHKDLTAPPNTLLRGAYNAMIASLNAERGVALDRDYVEGQIEYQKGNDALFQYEIQNGSDADLKEFARQTLPKIEDHLKRVQALAKSQNIDTAR
jgi:putative membrane protein